MKKCEDVFETSQKFLKNNQLKKDFDLLIVDFHGEITSEKNAMDILFDGKATLVVGTHTHIPTNDARILKNGTGYQTDAGMCGDYDSVIGMNKENSLNRFLKNNSVKHFPATGDATLCGVIVDCDIKTGLATDINSYIYGDQLKIINRSWQVIHTGQELNIKKVKLISKDQRYFQNYLKKLLLQQNLVTKIQQ